MNILVAATASKTSGALAIYRQFLKYLPNYTDGHTYYMFIDPSMEHPSIDNVNYIFVDSQSWMSRIWWDWIGLSRWLKERHIKPNVVVSLQNISPILNCRRIIYYHQSLPFYSSSWNPFKPSERILFLYKHIYPLFVRHSLNKRTDIVVQIQFIKKNFIKHFGVSSGKVHVMFPDVEKIEMQDVKDYDSRINENHFLYPATDNAYKQHKTLIQAIALLKKSPCYKSLFLHFTLSKESVPYKLAKELGVEEHIYFDGVVSHQQLLSMYKSSKCLLFPSIIETLGLPLLEAAAFGKPIIASNIEYAHDVLQSYQGVTYLEYNDYKAWANAIEQTCNSEKVFQPLKQKASSWSQFFDLVVNKNYQ